MLKSMIAALLLLASCGSPCLQVKAKRCDGNVLQTCGSNKKWQRVMDCSQLKPISPTAPKQWRCAETASGCTCVPQEGGK